MINSIHKDVQQIQF